MPARCSVYNCNDAPCKTKGITMHSYPFYDETRLQKWIAFTDRGPTWYPKKSAKMCSKHFVNPKYDERKRMLTDPCLRAVKPGTFASTFPSSRMLSFSNLKIVLPPSQSGISVRTDGIYFGTNAECSTSTTDNSNNAKEVEIGSPAAKKPKLENCLICKNVARDMEQDMKEKYSKLLITYVVPDAENDNKNLENCKLYNFCVPCTNTLEGLEKIKENIKTLQKRIDAKVETIKFCISKSPTKEGKELLEGKFSQTITTKEYNLPSGDGIVASSQFHRSEDGQLGTTSENVDGDSQDPLENTNWDYADAEIKSEVSEELNADNGDEEQPVPFEPWKRSSSSTNKEKLFHNELDNADKDCLMYVEPKVNESWSKPPLDFQQMTILAIVSSKNRRMSIRDICNFIGKYFPFYKTDSKVCIQVKRTVSTSDLFRLIDYISELQDQNLYKYVPFWTVVGKNLDEYHTRLAEILKSRELTSRSIAFPENVQTFVDNISLNVSPSTVTSNSSVLWKPPPFSYIQIIFFALTSQPDPVYTSQIIEYFKATFPYFTLLRDWDYGVFFNLQSEYFMKIVSEANPSRLAYCINISYVEDIKESILNTMNTLDLQNSQQEAKHFMRKPENLKDMVDKIMEYSMASGTES